MTTSPNYTEFSDPRQAALYDTFNALGADNEFFCQQAARIPTSSIIDFGCGTGLLTCELAKRGHQMIGVEPSEAMLAIARNKPYGEQVQWIRGGYQQLEGFQTDLVLMTSHVAQFFLDDKSWQEMLYAVYKVLKPGGHLVFDSRNPLTKPWEEWTRETSSKKRNDSSNRQIERWYQLLKVTGNHVLYEIHYLFVDSGEELISTNELIYRSQDEIVKSLVDTGFSIENIYGDWDYRLADTASPEMIFIAQR